MKKIYLKRTSQRKVLPDFLLSSGVCKFSFQSIAGLLFISSFMNQYYSSNYRGMIRFNCKKFLFYTLLCCSISAPAQTIVRRLSSRLSLIIILTNTTSFLECNRSNKQDYSIFLYLNYIWSCISVFRI